MKKLLYFVIGGLIMSNVNAITTKKIEFNSHGKKLVGNLYLPDNYDGKSKLPTILVTGAWTTVKEQMPQNYAQELAKKGFATMTFDFRGWGESEGKFRFVEDPTRKTEDIVEAVNFLSSRPEVDASKISGLGICASSGYMVKAYTETKKLKTIALVAPWLHNREIVDQVYGGKEAVDGYIKAGQSAEDEFKKSGKLQTVVAASTTDDKSLMFKAPYYTEKDRGLIKEYDNKFNVASWKGWLTFDAIAYADKLPNKVLFVESEAMALPQGSKAFKKIAGNKVESANIEKVTQFEFYDQKAPVNKSVDYITTFMNKNL